MRKMQEEEGKSKCHIVVDLKYDPACVGLNFINLCSVVANTLLASDVSFAGSPASMRQRGGSVALRNPG